MSSICLLFPRKLTSFSAQSAHLDPRYTVLHMAELKWLLLDYSHLSQ